MYVYIHNDLLLQEKYTERATSSDEEDSDNEGHGVDTTSGELKLMVQ